MKLDEIDILKTLTLIMKGDMRNKYKKGDEIRKVEVNYKVKDVDYDKKADTSLVKVFVRPI